jgi:regulator of sigma E protease
MQILFGIVVGLVVLMLIVTVHEFGHFIMARRNGVEVEEFAIGMGPKIKAWTLKSGLVFSLRWFPIGGFCKMKDENDASNAKGSFGRASLWGKTKILFGGVVFNWIFAAIILTILAWTGMPHFIEGQFEVPIDSRRAGDAKVVVDKVIEGSPAMAAGLAAGDTILGVAAGCEEECAEKVEVMEPEDMTRFDAEHAGEEISVNYRRGEEVGAVRAVLNEAGSEYLLGITMAQEGQILYRSTWSAPIVGVVSTVQLTGETFRGLGEMLWSLVSGLVRQVNFDSSVREEGAAAIEKAGEGVSGPVGIIGVIFPAFTQAGPTNLAFLTALISVSLACMNVLPIPALDGGRWVLIMIYRLRRKKLTREVEEKIVGRAFMVLMGLVVLITVLDVLRIFRHE